MASTTAAEKSTTARNRAVKICRGRTGNPASARQSRVEGNSDCHSSSAISPVTANAATSSASWSAMALA